MESDHLQLKNALDSGDNNVRVWKLRGERLNPACASQCNTAPTADVMPHVLPLMAGLPRAIFQQDNARLHTEKMSQDYLCHTNTLLLPARSPVLLPKEPIWDSLGQHVGQRTSWIVLHAFLQQLWNEMSQDFIWNFCVAMAARLGSCIRARGVQHNTKTSVNFYFFFLQ
ncbi:transposable element Tcb2 transposase [Trichonephila clavipes]|nr:transposable element Tcb2 transposase [Trichonephila clavipes]